MRRRELMMMLGCAALAMPWGARAEPAKVPLVAWLSGIARNAIIWDAFHRGLEETGFVDGQNVRVDERTADGRFDRLPALAAELSAVNPDIIVTGGGATPSFMSSDAKHTPLVSIFATDPVQNGFVQSFNRPGGNITGFLITSYSLEPKRLALLHEMVPQAHLVAALFRSGNPQTQMRSTDLRAAARTLGLELEIFEAGSPDDFGAVFAAVAERKAGALLVSGDPLFNMARVELVVLAARHGIPAIYEWREIVEAGGLMSYGDSLPAAYYQLGVYVGKILKGAKPADLPVVQSQKFEFAINLKTAKALGLAVPPNLLALADAVIE